MRNVEEQIRDAREQIRNFKEQIHDVPSTCNVARSDLILRYSQNGGRANTASSPCSRSHSRSSCASIHFFLMVEVGLSSLLVAVVPTVELRRTTLPLPVRSSLYSLKSSLYSFSNESAFKEKIELKVVLVYGSSLPRYQNTIRL